MHSLKLYDYKQIHFIYNKDPKHPSNHPLIKFNNTFLVKKNTPGLVGEKQPSVK